MNQLFLSEEYRNVVLAAGAAIIAIVLVAIVMVVVRRRRRARAMQAPLPLIPFSAGRGIASLPRPDGGAGSYNRARATAPTPAFSPPVADAAHTPAPASPYAPPPVARRNAGRPSPNNSLAGIAEPNDEAEGSEVDGASVRYWRPADGTLQFLPGRLEVIAGRDAGQEIRFVRTPGPDGTLVTFGRAEGAPYRHVQLREPTVSRAHARMLLESIASAEANGRASGNFGGPRWRLENLSATNPVVVNGKPLGADAGPTASVALAEGDRIEMGEVVFRFHEK